MADGPVARRSVGRHLRDFMEYLPARGLETLLAVLPRRASSSLGAGIGRLAASPLRLRLGVVEAQIAAAFPARPAAWVRETALACYAHFGREISEIARLARSGSAGLPERVAEGQAVVELYWRHAGPDRGGLIVTGHLGNWEVAGAFLAASGIPLAAVVKRQRNRRFDDHLLRTRRRLGIAPIFMEDANRLVPRFLKEGRAVALVADQDAGRRGVFVPFLGRPASTFLGPARLALASDVPLFFGATVRDAEGYRAVLEHIEPPLAGADAAELYTRRWVARLEAHVRQRPDQYFWLHRRWKTRPRGTTMARAR